MKIQPEVEIRSAEMAEYIVITHKNQCAPRPARVNKEGTALDKTLLGLAPLLHEKVDTWGEEEFKIWCDYHYSICREPSVLGSSNHVIIIGKNKNSPLQG